MIELASALTLPIAKMLLQSWLGDSVAVDVGDNLLKLGFNRFGDWTKARAAQQRANAIAGAVVQDLGDFFTKERVDEDALLPAAFELGETIRKHVDAAFLVNQRLNVETIRRGLLDARPVDKIYQRDEPEHGLYIQLVEELAPRLRVLAPDLPGFERERDAVLLQRLDDVAVQAPKLLEELRGVHEKLDELRERPAQLAQGFERDYLDAVVKELDYVEILGIEELDSKSRKADLTVAYLSLTARLVEGEEQQKIDFATVLTLLPLFGNRLWIEGGAGSGKSTLVRWTALQAARWRLGQAGTQDILDIAPDLYNWVDFLRPSKRGKKRGEKRNEANDGNKAEGRLLVLDREERLSRADREHPAKEALFEQAWRGRLPFVAHLRYATDRLTLGQLPHLTVRTIDRPPDGWLQEAFASDGASALLIFDGVDEVPAGRKREQVLEQIHTFAERFPNAQILVTSRPGAVDDGALDGFQKVVLEDLSEPQKLEFIDHWHQALATNFGRERYDTVVTQLRQAALRELELQPTLALLATNPLLCAAICALHWLSRRKVVEEAWQAQEPSSGRMQGTVLPGSLWNLCEALTRMLVHQRDLGQELGGAAFGPAYNLSYELKREILARIAYGMVAGDLLSAMDREEACAHVTAALAGFREPVRASANDVLQALLERSGVLRGSGDDEVEFVHNTLKAFLAAKFYLGLRTPAEMVRRIAAGRSEELASGLDEIAVFAAASPDHPAYAQRLIEALLSPQSSRSDARKFRILALRCEAAASSHLPREIRARVLRLAPKLFPPRDGHEARQLAGLGEEAIAHLGYQPRASAASSAATVHCLRLIGTAAAQEVMRSYLATESLVVAEELIRDYNPLRITAVLKRLQDHEEWKKVSPTIKAAIRDLAPLADLTYLSALILSGTQVVDATPLANLTKLQWLFLSRTRVASAEPLAGLSGLRQLELNDTYVRDIAPLANLAELLWLDLSRTQVADVAPLASITKVERLYLSGTHVSDLAPLADLTNLVWLDLSGTPVKDAAPLANLTNLLMLDLSNTQVSKEAVAQLERELAKRGNRAVRIAVQ